MVIRVNGEPIALESRAGESLGEALGRADKALELAGSVIVGLSVDGKRIEAEDYGALRELPAEGFALLEIAAEEASAYRAKAFGVLLELLELAKRTAAGQENQWQALREGSAELATSLAGLFGADELPLVQDLAALLERAAAEAGEGSPGESTRAELGSRAEALALLFNERLAELSSPAAELRKAAALFAREAEELKELPILLQTGKEDRAMKAVLFFIEIFYKVIRLMPELRRAGLDTEAIQVEGQGLPAFYASFNEILRRFSQAFEDKDSVLIGDLAEYEVTPRMAGLFAAIEGGLPPP